MMPRLALPGLLLLLLPSCQHLQLGRNAPVDEGANPYELTDNGGYSQGGFYGDPAGVSHGTAAGVYPVEGQTFSGYDAGAYSGAYSGAATSDHAQVAPFSESGYSAPSPPVRKPAVTPASKPPPRRAVASSPPKKPSPTSRPPSRTSAGTNGGVVVKAVYRPEGSSASSRKRATLHRVHTVKAGDTLSALASRYGVSVVGLKQHNQLPSDLIRVGQQLRID